MQEHSATPPHGPILYLQGAAKKSPMLWSLYGLFKSDLRTNDFLQFSQKKAQKIPSVLKTQFIVFHSTLTMFRSTPSAGHVIPRDDVLVG